MARPREAPQVGAAVERLLAALARRAEDEQEALEWLQRLHDASGDYLALGVQAYRDKHGYSWTDIGRILGITRQAAHKRFGRTET